MPIEYELRALAKTYSKQLGGKIAGRVQEMEADDQSHVLIYRVLGVTTQEGKMIDIYQNKGRFLYKYAGSFLEDATKLCFKHAFPDSGAKKILNTIGQRPKTFEIDCLVNLDAIEIKWRDATTDGDHINKEHTRIKVIAAAAYKPIRIMFYYPNRTQAKRIQETLETLYKGIGGEYHWGDNAWAYVKQRTGFDLKLLLETIAEENAHEDE
ncbi:MAG: ApaLI family restriction endonuclease [Methylococcales bacterium]|nr:ApaLI family restriction endonuclease [Methylococcales bacterium]